MTVERVVAYARKKGKRFGTMLEELELVTPGELAEALALQHNLKFLKDFHQYRFSDDLLKMVPSKVAIAHSIFPLKMQDRKLAVATSDPNISQVARKIADTHGVVVLPYIAMRSEIMLAIQSHYLKSSSDATAGKKCILIVEDDKQVQKLITALLNRKGYHVATANDGMEAFRKMVSVRPDLVLTDKEMPKLNGYAVLESVRAFPETSHVPVILMSAAATVDEEANALRRGFFDFIAKPLREATLLVKVERALARTETQ